MRPLKPLLASILAPAALGLLLAEPAPDPSAVAPLLNQAEALAAQGNHGAAAEALQNALKASPQAGALTPDSTASRARPR